MITRTDVAAAAARIAGRLRRTPVVAVEPAGLWLKYEYMQHTGSFKARGAINRVRAAQNFVVERADPSNRRGLGEVFSGTVVTVRSLQLGLATRRELRAG
jgi:threonine dehydratase